MTSQISRATDRQTNEQTKGQADKQKVKVKVTWIYIAPSRDTSKALRHGSHSFTCKQHHTYLYLVSVHQMAPQLTVVAHF